MRTKLHAITPWAAGASMIMCSAALGDGVATVTGPGGLIPASGTGGGGVWPTILPPQPFASSARSDHFPFAIISVTLTGVTHTWIGDLQIVLVDPAGNAHNVLHRPGFTGVGFGSSADFIGGTYVFTSVEAGAAQLPTLGSVPPGTYRQDFGVWPDGAAGIDNTPLSAISGGSGFWTLRIYDWAGSDLGEFDSWTMTYLWIPAPPGIVPLAFAAGLARRRRC